MWGLGWSGGYDRWLDEPYQTQFEATACERCERIFEPDDLKCDEKTGEVICTKCKEEDNG